MVIGILIGIPGLAGGGDTTPPSESAFAIHDTADVAMHDTADVAMTDTRT